VSAGGWSGLAGRPMNEPFFIHAARDSVAASIHQLLTDLVERAFGPGVRASVVGSLTWEDLGALVFLILGLLCLNGLVAFWIRKRARQASGATQPGKWIADLVLTMGKPIHAAVWIYGTYLAAVPLLAKIPAPGELDPMFALLDRLCDLGLIAMVLWVFIRWTRVLEKRLKTWAAGTTSKLDDVLIPILGHNLRILIPVVGTLFALPVLALPPQYAGVVEKASSILIISSVAWLCGQGVRLGEEAVLAKYDLTAADNLHARKVFTQTHVISKTLYVLIGIFTAASVLMLFDQVRQFGASILASAGVLGVVLGFAAQRTIANLFAGFQLAMTQPIRIDDVVIVEGEWGRVEEISLTFVVIHIWDDRRLVVPLSYFIEKPFQNWTRVSASLLGSVFLWVDYTLPILELRRVIQQIVEHSALWDRRFWNLQVTDASEQAMQIRVLATATDSSKAWDLRCEIREKLIDFIQERYPEALPKSRVNWRRAGRAEPGRGGESR